MFNCRQELLINLSLTNRNQINVCNLFHIVQLLRRQSESKRPLK